MCLMKFEHVSIFYGNGFKKKLKAPTEHCFVLKVHLQQFFYDNYTTPDLWLVFSKHY